MATPWDGISYVHCSRSPWPPRRSRSRLPANVYGDAVYTTRATTMVANRLNPPVRFTDNLFVGPEAGTVILDEAPSYDHDLYHRLRAGSPALCAGVAVPDNGGRDYYGNPLPPSAWNIGAYQVAGVPSAGAAACRRPA